MTHPIVLLFDIDGTLIEAGGAGGGALLKALEAEFELSDAQPVALHGRTDKGILAELLENHEVTPSEENVKRLCERYFASLPAELAARDGRLLPGVRDLLDELKECQEVCLALLSGNMPKSAWMKLEHYELSSYFEFGVFGDLASHRPDLAQPAFERIEKHIGKKVAKERVVIVGDTPLDIELADAMEVHSLAVCTGGFPQHELQGATRVALDLSKTSELVPWLMNPQ